MLLIGGLLAGAIVVTACGNARTAAQTNSRAVVPGIARDGDSGVEGLVTIGPTCPVERADSPCPDKPYPTQVIALSSGGTELARAVTDAEGRFALALSPGDYHLTEAISGTLPRPIVVAVHVVSGAWTFVHLTLDSGIR
jgi:hypothetical protein